MPMAVLRSPDILTGAPATILALEGVPNCLQACVNVKRNDLRERDCQAVDILGCNLRLNVLPVGFVMHVLASGVASQLFANSIWRVIR